MNRLSTGPASSIRLVDPPRRPASATRRVAARQMARRQVDAPALTVGMGGAMDRPRRTRLAESGPDRSIPLGPNGPGFRATPHGGHRLIPHCVTRVSV